MYRSSISYLLVEKFWLNSPNLFNSDFSVVISIFNCYISFLALIRSTYLSEILKFANSFYSLAFFYSFSSNFSLAFFKLTSARIFSFYSSTALNLNSESVNCLRSSTSSSLIILLRTSSFELCSCAVIS